MTQASKLYTSVDPWQANARLALDTISMRPTRGIPT